MGKARNRPRASSSPYFAIHSTIIHFTRKKTFSRKHKSDAVFCGQMYGQICRKYCFVRFLRAVYTKKFIQNTKGDVWQYFSRLFCHRRARRFLEGISLEHRNPELTNLHLPSLTLRFQPRSRPFVWLLALTWIRKNTDCFAVYPPAGSLIKDML